VRCPSVAIIFSHLGFLFSRRINPRELEMTAISTRLLTTLALGVTAASSQAIAQARPGAPASFQETFRVDKAKLASTGTNPYLSLMPGEQLTLDGLDGGKNVKLVITVLNQTEIVDGVTTRVVEERETADGMLAEVSRNFFAISPTTKDVYYFGEDVDNYKDGKVVSHESAWRAGVQGARFGLFLPGSAHVGAKFYQELAPNVAMDRFEITSISKTLKTPGGSFDRCLVAEETTPLEPSNKAAKVYAPGVGLIQDGTLFLVSHRKEPWAP
jgi:hypothetical protein